MGAFGDYAFEQAVQACSYIPEATSYLEIFSYSDPSLNTIKEHPLAQDAIDNFMIQRGTFKQPSLREGATMLGAIRLV
ncbi:hypothetical protein VTL71DRAFT_15325 [Oculimacula yallundae]|uniref:Uncharacterized protein n=1 Tax=Oculimacula yallundae TaxID=86028 RepID=A0ABR4CHJ4_9HELO